MSADSSSISRSEWRDRGLARWAMPVSAALLAVLAGAAALRARGWPLMHDAPLIHYVVLLMAHGRAPYRDIIEMNMPGAYMIEWAAMHLFGWGALGWWRYDTLLAAIGIASSAWIAGPGRRSAGVAAGAMAYLCHQWGGPSDVGQRDWCIAVLLLAGFGCLFQAIRKGQPVWMAGFMGLCGAAASVKPPVLAMGICFAAAVCWRAGHERDGRPHRWLAFGAWSLLGGMIPAAAVGLFLARWGVGHEFLETLRGLVPWYGGLERLSIARLLGLAAYDNRRLALIALCGLGGLMLGRSWRRWESRYLGLAAMAGLAVFLAQGKGWSYHLGTETAFVALWGTLELDAMLEGPLRPGRRMQVAAAAALLLTLAMFAQGLRSQSREDFRFNDAVPSLESDLKALGGQRLSGRVQCLDMTAAGCINVLYRMRLMQATGFIYDFYLFPKAGNAVTARLQQRFLEEVNAHPPEVIVLSAHTWPGGYFGYDQVSHWPAFEAVLADRYRLAKELPQPKRGPGYRLYVLKAPSAMERAGARRVEPSSEAEEGAVHRLGGDGVRRVRRGGEQGLVE